MNNAINVYTFPRYKEICALKFSSKPNFFENLVCFYTLKQLVDVYTPAVT